MKKIWLTFVLLSFVQASNIKIPSYDVITQLRHLSSILKIKTAIITPFVPHLHVPKYSKFWNAKFVSSSSNIYQVLEEYFDHLPFFHNYESDTKILYVDLSQLKNKKKDMHEELIKLGKELSTTTKYNIAIATKHGINLYEYPPSVSLEKFIEDFDSFDQVNYAVTTPEVFDNLLNIDYFPYPVSYFMTFEKSKFIYSLKKIKFFQNEDIAGYTKLIIWEVIYQKQDTTSLDYLIQSFYSLEEHIRSEVVAGGVIPNPNIYNKRYSTSGIFSKITQKIYSDFPNLSNDKINKTLRSDIKVYQKSITKILSTRFGRENLSQNQTYILNNLHKAKIKNWPKHYRTIRIYPSLEMEDWLDYLHDSAKTVNQLKDWFNLISINQ